MRSTPAASNDAPLRLFDRLFDASHESPSLIVGVQSLIESVQSLIVGVQSLIVGVQASSPRPQASDLLF